MGARRRWIRRTLAALTALVLLGVIGVGVWAASTDEDQPLQATLGASSDGGAEEGTQPESAEPTENPVIQESPEPGDEPSLGAEPPATTPEDPAGEPAPSEPAPGESGGSTSGEAPPGESAPGEPTKTRFPRERSEDPDRRGGEFVVPPAREFTGAGNALIGTVVVSQPVVVRWRSRGRFGLEFGREAFPIVAPSRSGQLVVPPFTFELVRVVASGSWTITVTPQG
jgi:hypothetical protein